MKRGGFLAGLTALPIVGRLLARVAPVAAPTETWVEAPACVGDTFIWETTPSTAPWAVVDFAVVRHWPRVGDGE